MSETHASVDTSAADLAQIPSLPPRILLRSAWLLHRTAEAGSKFGMLRLTTIGRRSGQSRVAIVGYFEDGPNLVTLAMNGWGEAERAWWLNLQEQPETTVELGGESRAVRAHAAAGKERDRLWAKFRDYPGWGSDLDGLAGLRSRQPAVVVLEPRPSIHLKGRSHATSS